MNVSSHKIEFLENVCQAAGVPPTDTNIEHAATLATALRLFHERDAVRGSTWHAAGLQMMATLAKSKSERLLYHEGHLATPHLSMARGASRSDILEAAEDDALDLINYATFCARLVREQVEP